ncbi:MAG: hypothetical protein HQK52_16900 [Oligoflexia bacterium]|nr:hypothetical protein [Oligoflexia bacterium]
MDPLLKEINMPIEIKKKIWIAIFWMVSGVLVLDWSGDDSGLNSYRHNTMQDVQIACSQQHTEACIQLYRFARAKGDNKMAYHYHRRTMRLIAMQTH